MLWALCFEKSRKKTVGYDTSEVDAYSNNPSNERDISDEAKLTLDRLEARREFLSLRAKREGAQGGIVLSYSYGTQEDCADIFMNRMYNSTKIEVYDKTNDKQRKWFPAPICGKLPKVGRGCEGIQADFLSQVIGELYGKDNRKERFEKGERGLIYLWNRLVKMGVKKGFICMEISQSELSKPDMRAFLKRLQKQSRDEVLHPLLTQKRRLKDFWIFVHFHILDEGAWGKPWKRIPIFRKARNLGKLGAVSCKDIHLWFERVFGKHPERIRYWEIFQEQRFAGQFFQASWVKRLQGFSMLESLKVIDDFVDFVNHQQMGGRKYGR